MTDTDQAAPAATRPPTAAVPAAPADELARTVGRAAADLSQITRQLPGGAAADPAAAATLARLSGDMARAAAMTIALPGRPPAAPGHTFAAATAICTAMHKEQDFTQWLATVLASIDPDFACRVTAAALCDLIVGGRNGGPVTAPETGSRFASGPHIRPLPGIIGVPGPAREAAPDTPGPGPVTGPPPPSPLPLPPGKPYSQAALQALDDAMNFRRARLAIDCDDCQPGLRCDDHDADTALIGMYRQMRQQASAALPPYAPARAAS